MSEISSLDGRLTIRLEMVPGKTVADRIALAADCGFDGIAFPGRFRDRFGSEALKHRDRLALPIRTVSLGFEGSLCSPIPERRETCRKSLVELFDFTAELGASSVNMPPVLIPDNPDRFPKDDSESQDRLLAEQLPSLGDAAAERGLALLLEPVNQSESDYLHRVAHTAEICRAVNHSAIGLTPDFYHMQLEETDIAAALTTGAPWIDHVHTAEDSRVEPGPGNLDFRPGFKALKESGYAGLVEIECRSLSGPAEKVLPKSADYLRTEWKLA